jgi:hypothetical protein
MLKMAFDVATLGVDIHKWAALEKTQVFPVKPVLHLAFFRAAAGVLLKAIWAMLA